MSYSSAVSFFHVQLLQEEKKLKDVKTAVNGLVEVFKVGRFILFSVANLMLTTC